ncbi:hypothetical protein FB451DRAFT_1390439 [Mycena latifolia]|nr:hypothetical protein FB451DRAFT_1390439 [Mycena latifolia]
MPQLDMPWARWLHLLAGLQSIAVEPCWAMMKTCQDVLGQLGAVVEDASTRRRSKYYELDSENVDEFQESIDSVIDAGAIDVATSAKAE